MCPRGDRKTVRKKGKTEHSNQRHPHGVWSIFQENNKYSWFHAKSPLPFLAEFGLRSRLQAKSPIYI